MEKITILTKPIKNNLVKKILSNLLRKPNKMANFHSGPDAVLKSLINGFNRLNVKYNLNPKEIKEIGKTVIVLSNIEALKQAIDLKKKKKINHLLAGPNLVVFSSDFDHIIASPEIDICLVPSKQVAKLYVNDDPTLVNRTKIWYAGVDENYWKPNNNNSSSNNIIIYYKNVNNNLRKKVTMLLKEYHWNPIHIKYGCYTPEEYKSALSMSRFTVFLSNKESQGISLTESWSMNIPTFVWNPKKTIIQDRLIKNYSSAPYLTNKTGIKWDKIDDLENILVLIYQYIRAFNPRKWILENMTDIKSAKLLLNIIRTITV